MKEIYQRKNPRHGERLKRKCLTLCKKAVSVFLAQMMIIGTLGTVGMTAFAAGTPTAEAAENVTYSSFDVNWTAVSGTEHYYLDVATDSSFTDILSGYDDKDMVTATTCSLTGLSSVTNYFYRVRADSGSYSNIVYVQTPAENGEYSDTNCANTSGYEYSISTPEHLKLLDDKVNDGIATYSGVTFKLADNIDLSDYGSGYDSGAGWKPIGVSTNWSFQGKFDGNGYVVKNMYINRPSTGAIGLFGYMNGASAQIKNVGVVDCDITGGARVGAIVGWAYGSGDVTISECFSIGSVKGTRYVGGILGQAESDSVTVQNCYSTAHIAGTRNTETSYEGDNGFGGIIGYIYAPGARTTTIINCYSTGGVSGPNGVGGILGCVEVRTGSTINVYVKNCMALNSSITSTFDTQYGENTDGVVTCNATSGYSLRGYSMQNRIIGALWKNTVDVGSFTYTTHFSDLYGLDTMQVKYNNDGTQTAVSTEKTETADSLNGADISAATLDSIAHNWTNGVINDAGGTIAAGSTAYFNYTEAGGASSVWYYYQDRQVLPVLTRYTDNYQQVLIAATNLGQTLPYATDVYANSAGASLTAGNTLSGTYTYNSNGAGNESGTTYKWYRYDTEKGGTASQIAATQSYQLTSSDQGKYISFEVTPSDGTVSGSAVESERIGPVATAIGVVLGDAALSGGKYYYTAAEVTGDDIQTILISFSDNVTSGDEIVLPAAPAGFTVSSSSNDYAKRINLDNGVSTSAVQSYLRGVGFAIASENQTVSVTVTTNSITTDTYYNIDTEHYYQYITADTSGIYWTDAYTAAKSLTYMGRTGYLATVMSLEEDIYLNSLSGGKTGWLGGTIMTNSGSLVDASGGSTGAKLYYSSFTPTSVVSGDNKGWYWACGPEIGTIFYDTNSLNNEGGASADTADTVDARNSTTYYNWSRGASYEPNNKTATDASDSGDYETCLTTLINSGHTGKHGTVFTWNDGCYNYTDQDSAWSAKGYFVEYGNELKGDDGSGSTTFASDSGSLNGIYGATVNVNLDGSVSSSPVTGNVELWQSGSKVYTMTGGSGVYTASAVNGTYNIYINGGDTGETVAISGGSGSATVDYYTVSFAVSNAGTAANSTISATAGGSSITSGTAVLSGKQVVITAAGAGASTYTYAWSGTGTSGETTAVLTINSLGGAVNATCMATGTTTYGATVNVNLDGSASSLPVTGNVELWQSGSKVYTMTGGSGVYTASAVNGTYNIYINGGDTGETVAISGGIGSATVDYYTVSFAVSNAGTAANSTITATYDGSTITSGAVVLGGRTLVITAAGAGADDYSYFWSGAGANGEASSAITLSSLNSKTDVLCTVTGRATPTTYSVSLYTNGGTINSGSLTSYTYGVGATLPTGVTKGGSDFSGWYAESDFSGSPVTSIGTTDTGDKTFYARWNYTVGGKVTDDNGTEAYGATVTIQGNNITSQSTTADTDGCYSFSDIPAGDYNIVAVYNGVTQTIIITVTGSDINDANIQMPEGAKNSVLEVAENTPNVVVGYLNQQFTDSDNEYIEGSGNTVEIKLTVEKQSEDVADGAADIQTLAGSRTIGMYLDMTLTKTMTGTTDSTDTLASSESLLKIIIPYDLTGKINVVVYRYHNGVAEAMTETAYSSDTPADECYMVNASRNQLIVWTMSFSTYAISYLNAYTVSYDGNGATGGSVPASGTAADGTVWSSPGNSGGLARTDYSFKGWALTSDATEAVSTYTINSDTVFYAVWKYSGGSGGSTKYTITATAGDGGSISPSGSVIVTGGGSKTFTITADEGYYINDVLVDGESAGAVGSYTFSDVSESHTIKAVFAETTGLPYYVDDDGNEVFIGFAAETGGKMKYIAPDGVTVLFKENPKSFTDTDGHWAKSYIGFVTEREIFVGTGGNVFSPDTGMTRAMFATVIGRLYERSYGKINISDVRAFTDCDYDDYYGKYVDWAAEKGIILGYGNGRFGPDDQITREQMAAILYGFADFLGVVPGDMDTALTYPDAGTISDWAQSAALYCQTTGIISGRDGGVFAPQGTATRAEVAAILERFIENTLD